MRRTTTLNLEPIKKTLYSQNEHNVFSILTVPS